MSRVTDFIRLDKEYAALADAIKKEVASKQPMPILATGLCEGALDATLVSLIKDLKRDRGQPALILTADEKTAVRITSILKKNNLEVGFFVARDLTFYNITASHEYEHERLCVLSGILGGRYDAVVTTPDAALGFTIPPKKLLDLRCEIEYGKTLINFQDFISFLIKLGYVRVEMVDAPGQFAVRGGIFDVFPAVAKLLDSEGKSTIQSVPFRIELFGDEIDRLETFDVETQRMITSLEAVELYPSREILMDAEAKSALTAVISAQLKKAVDSDTVNEIKQELDALNSGRELNFLDKYISVIYPERVCLLDYFDSNGIVFFMDTVAVNDRIKASQAALSQTVEDVLQAGTVAPKYAIYSKDFTQFKNYLDRLVGVHFNSLSQTVLGDKQAGIFNFRTKHTVSYGDNFSLLCEDIVAYRTNAYKIYLLAENEASAKSVSELLREKGEKTFIDSGEINGESELFLDGITVIGYKDNARGFELSSPKLAVLSLIGDDREKNYATSSLRRRRKAKKGTEVILSYNDLEIGDYVVHEIHGLGQYMGIENLKVDGVSRDYINIRYAGSDKLFLPVEKLDMVSKYIGAHSDDGLVKLSRFGGAEWNKTKTRARAAVKDIAKELIKLYAERERREGFAFPEDDALQMEFEGSFEYEATDGQLMAIEEVKRDMEKSRPMDRLICGDVGFGKTEVAMRAAYKAVLGGKQVAVLVPTTILALQHYQTFTSRMRAFGVGVDMISRFRTTKQQAQSLRKLKRGETDIIIGTHKLIGKNIEFKDLGLLIVDEEQRFGVSQKEKLKQLASNVDVLTLTATPIPRTLNMAMGGIRDISVLDEAPGDRLPVQTYVLDHDELIITEAIRRELRRGGQVFYLYNFVEGIDTCAAKIAKAIPEARITVAHGKMNKEELENIWSDMLSGEIDILVSTTIIETGVDVPNANTLIVENAHRLGLSQLHQIRGRVGRSSRRAYAYFTFPKDRAINEIAIKRLEAIRDYAEFGAGFKIAIRDLEIRGAGNLLGAEQHGHLDAVGYELYIKLLNEAVLEERGEVIPVKKECTVTLRSDAFISDKYVPYSSQRMGLYKRIAMLETREDREDIIDELIDRYGDVPRATLDLLTIAIVRAAAIKCDVVNIVEEISEVRIYQASFDEAAWKFVFEDKVFKGRTKFIGADPRCIVIKKKNGENIPEMLLSLFEDYQSARGENAQV